MSHYDDNLEHMAEPSAPKDRRRAISITLDLLQATFMRGWLREWASQPKIGEEDTDIALGYVEWIERELQRGKFADVTLYIHTRKAEQVLSDALYDEWPDTEQVFDKLRDVEDQIAIAWGHFHHDDEVYDEDGVERPEPAPTGLEGVPDGR